MPLKVVSALMALSPVQTSAKLEIMKTDKELYQQKAQAQLDGWKAELDKLKSKASAASADAQLELNEKIRELQPEIEAGQAKLTELESAGEEAWESLKSDMESAWASLEATAKEATARLKD